MTSHSKIQHSLDVYELTAKLMAGEDITVMMSQNLKHPAQFHQLTRVLKIATLEGDQEFLTLGLIVHEIGHALYTNPTEDDIKNGRGVSQLFNIVEDGYQERKTCKKYPGGKKYLFQIFDHFFIKDDEIGNPKKKLSKLIQILNILNYNCKGQKQGFYHQYPDFVYPEDVEVLHDIEVLNDESYKNRYQKVLELSILLKRYMKDGEDLDNKDRNGSGGDDKPTLEDTDPTETKGKQPAQQNSTPSNEDNKDDSKNPSGMGDNKNPDDNREDDKGDFDNKDDEQGQETGSKDKGEISEDTTKNKGSPKGAQGEKELRDALKEIEKFLGDNKDDLNDHHVKLNHNLSDGNNSYNSPDARMIEDLSFNMDVSNYTHKSRFNDDWRKDFNKSKIVANRIFTAFNLRKNADNITNTSYQQTGVLDPLKLSQYKITDDIFVCSETNPAQTNHAYVVMLDWSASMDGSCLGLVHRVMELAQFANLADVELEIYLYTTSYGINGKLSKYPDTLFNQGKFIKVLNTKHDPILKHLRSLYEIATIITHHPVLDLHGHDMHGTNIFEGTVIGHHKLEKMNAHKKTLMILTDGQDATLFASVFDSEQHKAIGVYPRNISTILYHGKDIDDIIPGNINQRTKLTKAECLMREQQGQNTVCISWNVESEDNEYMFPKNISIKSTSNKYKEVDNRFINQLVENLI